MTPTNDFLAKEIHNAVSGIGTDEETIIEIICTASNTEINNIKMAYHKCILYWNILNYVQFFINIFILLHSVWK